ELEAYYQAIHRAALDPEDRSASTVLARGGRWNTLFDAVSTWVNAVELEYRSVKASGERPQILLVYAAIAALLKNQRVAGRELKGQFDLQQPRVIAGFGPYRVVKGVEVQLHGLAAEVKRFAEAAADRHSPLPTAGDPVRGDLRRRADRPSV